ncbi:hypothetical protein ASD05_17510 [Variovorax sp. Root434]|nr:hypothetical protein ASD05_17510 [Variovorax sp. Root434]
MSSRKPTVQLLCWSRLRHDPRRRRLWFDEPFEASARIHATRTLNKRSPRMVKRRHSPYASFDHHAPKRMPIE